MRIKPQFPRNLIVENIGTIEPVVSFSEETFKVLIHLPATFSIPRPNP